MKVSEPAALLLDLLATCSLFKMCHRCVTVSMYLVL